MPEYMISVCFSGGVSDLTTRFFVRASSKEEALALTKEYFALYTEQVLKGLTEDWGKPAWDDATVTEQ